MRSHRLTKAIREETKSRYQLYNSDKTCYNICEGLHNLEVRMKTEKLPHVVIVGAGFGGLKTAQKLAGAPVRITLIDRHNYHLFQPLLYQIAIAGLVPAQIAYPLRTIFRRQKNLAFQMGEVTAIDFDAHYIRTNGSVIGYDTLVLAIGGEANFYGLT